MHCDAECGDLFWQRGFGCVVRPQNLLAVFAARFPRLLEFLLILAGVFVGNAFIELAKRLAAQKTSITKDTKIMSVLNLPERTLNWIVAFIRSLVLTPVLSTQIY